MREIKFRVWNTTSKEMTIPFQLGSQMSMEIYTMLGDIIMQYTGLHDKNGKEIYEGDIWESGFKELIEWNDECSGYAPFTVPGEGGYEWECQDPKDGIVIGNVFENPELLNGRE